MPIRLNLLAEELAAREDRRRDPTKRAVLAGCLVVGAAVAVVVMGQLEVMRRSGELNARTLEWKEMEPTYQALVANLRETAVVEARLDDLHQLATNRFLVAPALAMIERVWQSDDQVRSKLRLTQIRTLHEFDSVEAVKEVKDADGTVRKKGEPAKAIERIKIIVEGRDYSNSSDGEMTQQFAADLEEEPMIGDGGGRVQMNPLSLPLSDIDDPSKIYRHFSIECILPEKVN